MPEEHSEYFAPSRKANPVDEHVGKRVRFRRRELDISQEELGRRLGVTFQQMQKYEGGANRITAGRLFQISRVLKVPVAFFFEGLGEAPARGESVLDLLTTRQSVDFVRTFMSIKDDAARRVVTDLSKVLAAA
jgi:transcriptional regulator with XRE-family HTH domain